MLIRTVTDDWVNTTFIDDYIVVKTAIHYEVRARLLSSKEVILAFADTYAEASEFLHELLEEIKDVEYEQEQQEQRLNAFKRPETPFE